MTYPRTTLKIMSAKFSWKQDLKPNSYCTAKSEHLEIPTVVKIRNDSIKEEKHAA